MGNNLPPPITLNPFERYIGVIGVVIIGEEESRGRGKGRKFLVKCLFKRKR